MRIVSKEYPEELGYWTDFAIMEDIYSIAVEGEGRKEGILMANAKRQETLPVAINMPNISTEPVPQNPPPAKKHWWSRGQGK